MTRRHYRIYLWVSKEEKERMISESVRMGFANLNAYLRWCATMNNTILKELEEIKFLVRNDG